MKFDSILLFEQEFTDSIYPFSIMHSWWEVRCGYFRLFEKLQHLHPDKKIIFGTDSLHLASFLEKNECADQTMLRESILAFNSAILPTRKLFDEMLQKFESSKELSVGRSALFTNRGLPFAMYLPEQERLNPSDRDKEFLPEMMIHFRDQIPQIEIESVRPISFLWEAIELCGEEINNDFVYLSEKEESSNADFMGVHFAARGNCFIGKDVKIAPGAIIDASAGAVIIGNRAQIMHNSVLIGPCAIGEDSIIKVGAKIYENTSIGPVSKVGGEVEASIIHAYSNKQHDGFLGHSYLGEWVNLGADTNTSDLKNNYGKIKVELRHRKVDTDRMFLGLLAGDHTKTGINTMLNTGSVIGLSCNVFGGGYPEKSIQSFSWGESSIYDFEKAVEVARIVAQRRGREFTKSDEALFKEEWKKERDPETILSHGCGCSFGEEED
jgi:UDP-N-acetylglucosamine diphosphorylase/glucosamine-1-phosphate N-acetyltransferase